MAGAGPAGPAGSASTPGSWSTGMRFGVPVGGLVALVSVAAIDRVWADCDTGVNTAADSLALLFLAPLIWIAAALPWAVLHGTLGRRHRGAALAAGLAFTVWFTWFLVTWLGVLDSYPDPTCPGNVPPWWPSWLPS
ncbi:hypothetical protein [Streptomyces sp. NPDC005374]|uniref:hypothetical protein n=1 Tax=Streptomyces sp. NPDC005374 TaxID=3364713 RepID=UPI00368E3E19